MLAREFTEKLVEHNLLTPISLALPSGRRTFYCRGPVNPYRLAIGLVPNAYLSHQSALYLHGLLPTAPPQIYVNQEQRAKPRVTRDALTQGAIDDAFAKAQRQPQQSTTYQGHELLFLNGKATGLSDVINRMHPLAGTLKVTSLERTLLDITVRPRYAGGVAQVLRAYRAAAPLISVSKLADLLEKLDYRYPYHQAVGFYLDLAGTYKPDDLEPFQQREKALDFYLAHAMGETTYSPSWRVYYPSELISQVN